jgi:lipopolysaccharide transport system ATP-binding protein
MSDPIIKVEDLSKRYFIGHRRPKGDGLRHIAEGAMRAPVKWLRDLRTQASAKKQEFWALKNVSFEVKRGEVLGVIGRNGAGKSTLLKILSRITEPTSGRITLEGRVASLLEVGTGFHPELTGRENIFLNGAILGMSHVEIKRKFDEIVAFSEVEKFLETPVKRYSSGMYVRLAFAVAAHLEPEILIVDEVLAVGDAQFQQKCLGKMGEVAKEGSRTVIFVSHQMAAITNLCRSCILMSQGTVAYAGNTEEAVRRNLDSSPIQPQESELTTYRARWAEPFIKSARVLDMDGNPQSKFPLGAGMIFELSYMCEEPLPFVRSPVMGVVIKHAVQGTVAGVNMRMTGSVVNQSARQATIRCLLPNQSFLQGNYSVDLWLGDSVTDIDLLEGYLHFSIEASDIYGTGQIPFANMGMIFLQPRWTVS